MVLGNFLTFLKRVVSDPADQAELTLWISWDPKKIGCSCGFSETED